MLFNFSEWAGVTSVFYICTSSLSRFPLVPLIATLFTFRKKRNLSFPYFSDKIWKTQKVKEAWFIRNEKCKFSFRMQVRARGKLRKSCGLTHITTVSTGSKVRLLGRSVLRHITQITPYSRVVFRSRQSLRKLRNASPFMKTEASLP
jgi:hypothetical protein